MNKAEMGSVCPFAFYVRGPPLGYSFLGGAELTQKQRKRFSSLIRPVLIQKICTVYFKQDYGRSTGGVSLLAAIVFSYCPAASFLKGTYHEGSLPPHNDNIRPSN